MQAFCRWAGLHIILRYLLFKTEGILRKKATRLGYALMRMPHYSLKVPYFDFAKYYNMILYQYIYVFFNITVLIIKDLSHSKSLQMDSGSLRVTPNGLGVTPNDSNSLGGVSNATIVE